MSGSPIYLDGRLAGAYAYSWSSFQVEPVAGVTPIAPMLTEMTRPIPPGFWPLEGERALAGWKARSRRPEQRLESLGPGNGATAFDGAPGSYDVEVARNPGRRRGSLPGSIPLVRSSRPRRR